jgi:hypothetical protein
MMGHRPPQEDTMATTPPIKVRVALDTAPAAAAFRAMATSLEQMADQLDALAQDAPDVGGRYRVAMDPHYVASEGQLTHSPFLLIGDEVTIESVLTPDGNVLVSKGSLPLIWVRRDDLVAL